MDADEREVVLNTLKNSIIDLEKGALSLDACVLLVGLLVDLRDITNDPQLVVAREKAKALIYWTFDGTPEMEEAAPYLKRMESTPDESKLH